jgi:DNA-binding NtrC family response regulator
MAYIVAVDDEQLWRELHEQHIQEIGHTVDTYEDGRLAIASCGAETPDLVILDLGMYPSGRSMLLRFKQKWPHVPVIIYTSYAGYEDDSELSKADAFVAKSSDFTALGAAIERILGGRKEKRQC